MNDDGISCEQIIFTRIQEGNNPGYQITAKSDGISPSDESFLYDYFLPPGVNPTYFKECRVSLNTPSGNISFSKIVNLGSEHPEKEGILYNHTIIVSKSNFQILVANIFAFDSFFHIDLKAKGRLTTLRITPIPERYPDFNIIKKNIEKSQLLRTLAFLMKGEKTAILINSDKMEDDLIRNIIMVLPSSLRTISFSTFAPQPLRQRDLQLIQLSEAWLNSEIAKVWKLINPHKPAVERSNENEYLEQLVNAVFQDNMSDLISFHKLYNELPNDSDTNTRLEYCGKWIAHQRAITYEQKFNTAISCLDLSANISQRLLQLHIGITEKTIKEADSDVANNSYVDLMKVLYQNNQISEFERIMEKYVRNLSGVESQNASHSIQKFLQLIRSEDVEKYLDKILNKTESLHISYSDILAELSSSSSLRPLLTKLGYLSDGRIILEMLNHILEQGRNHVAAEFLNETLKRPKSINELQDFVSFLSELVKIKSIENIREEITAIVFNKIKGIEDNFLYAKKTVWNRMITKQKFELKDSDEAKKYLELISQIVKEIMPVIKKKDPHVHGGCDVEIKKWFAELQIKYTKAIYEI